MYFTDRGISELAERRGEEGVTLAWLAEKLSEFVDIHPEHEAMIDQLATWLARADDDLDLRSAFGPVARPQPAALLPDAIYRM